MTAQVDDGILCVQVDNAQVLTMHPGIQEKGKQDEEEDIEEMDKQTSPSKRAGQAAGTDPTVEVELDDIKTLGSLMFTRDTNSDIAATVDDRTPAEKQEELNKLVEQATGGMVPGLGSVSEKAQASVESVSVMGQLYAMGEILTTPMKIVISYAQYVCLPEYISSHVSSGYVSSAHVLAAYVLAA